MEAARVRLSRTVRCAARQVEAIHAGTQTVAIHTLNVRIVAILTLEGLKRGPERVDCHHIGCMRVHCHKTERTPDAAGADAKPEGTKPDTRDVTPRAIRRSARNHPERGGSTPSHRTRGTLPLAAAFPGAADSPERGAPRARAAVVPEIALKEEGARLAAATDD